MHNPVQWFAELLRRGLIARAPLATHLELKVRGKAVTIGITEGDAWVPLLRLSVPSASANVMNLDVRHGATWAPTFERGTPDMLADKLCGPLAFTWSGEVQAVLDWRGTSDLKH
jgi:hypothetical protein